MVEGIGVELCRLVMVERFLALVKKTLVVQGGLSWNRLERELSAGRPVGAAGARGGRGRGEPLPHQVKRTAKPTLQTGRRRQSQPCGVRSWREHERGAPLSRRPRVVFAKRRGDGVRGRGGASSSARRGPSEKSELVVRCEAGLKRGFLKAGDEFGIPEAMPAQPGEAVRGWVRTSLSLQTEHLRALMWVSFCVWSIVLLRRCISSPRVRRRRLRRGAMGGGSPTRSAAVVAGLQAFGRNLGKPLRHGDGAVPSASIGEIRTGGEDGPTERRPQNKNKQGQ